MAVLKLTNFDFIQKINQRKKISGKQNHNNSEGQNTLLTIDFLIRCVQLIVATAFCQTFSELRLQIRHFSK